MFEGVFKSKKVFITGHTGFKGAWLTLWLQTLGAEVAGFSAGIPTEPSLFSLLNLSSTLHDLRGDIRDQAALQQAILTAQPDFVFHLAAQAIVSTSYQQPVDTFSANVMGTVHVLDALRKLDKPCTAIIVTSDKCYENREWEFGYRESDPLGGKDPYSASKAAAELAINAWYHSFFQDSGVRVLSVRSGNVIGGGDWAPNRVVPDCIRSWQEGRPVVLRSPGAIRPWQHVLEPLAGYLLAAQHGSTNPGLNGQAFNFGPRPDQTCSVEDMVKGLARHWPGLKEENAFITTPNLEFKESRLLKLSWEKAWQDLGWKPKLVLQTTLKMTAEWYQALESGLRENDLREFTLRQIREF
ncbi:MAG: CDP-glucose 4,6-dehydratase [Bacteroidia bacterium]|nr:CDP-glucose 4,6-dehydratase [Bacteroidia bacterium]